MSQDRLYNITYEDDDTGELCEAVVPEFALPTIDFIMSIEVCGRLKEGFKIVIDEDPEDGSREDLPIPLRTGTN